MVKANRQFRGSLTLTKCNRLGHLPYNTDRLCHTESAHPVEGPTINSLRYQEGAPVTFAAIKHFQKYGMRAAGALGGFGEKLLTLLLVVKQCFAEEMYQYRALKTQIGRLVDDCKT
jgi:hypothetical protein